MILYPGCTLETPGEQGFILGQQIRISEREASTLHPR